MEGPIDDVVPAERAITVRDLLTLRGGHGYPSNFDSPVPTLLTERLKQGPPRPLEVPATDEWMARLAEVPLLHQPGQGWTYNTGSTSSACCWLAPRRVRWERCWPRRSSSRSG